MGLARNFSNPEDVAKVGQDIIHGHGWQTVTVRRANDNSKNVGVTSELDATVTEFTIKARIDPLESKEDSQKWLGLVETHILPMMRKGDQWLLQKPNAKFDTYKITRINADEIELEKI